MESKNKEKYHHSHILDKLDKNNDSCLDLLIKYNLEALACDVQFPEIFITIYFSGPYVGQIQLFLNKIFFRGKFFLNGLF